MKLKLSSFIHTNLSSWELLDPTLKPSPEKNNPWALWCGWVFDWLFAIILTKMCVSSWITFMSGLGLNSLPSQVIELVTLKSKGLEVLLIPFVFFTIHYTSLHFHSKTLGMKLFRHHVEFKTNQGVWLYTLGLMVSPVLMGIPLLNSWIDQFAQAETHSSEFSYFSFTYQEEKFESINLLDQLEPQYEEEFDQAA